MSFKLNKIEAVLLLFAIAVQLQAQAAIDKEGESHSVPRTRQCFDEGWLFFKGDSDGAQLPDFDASSWRVLDLPHDWSIEGPYDAGEPSGASGGYLPCGVGWYRKTFRVPAEAEGRIVTVEFDGVYMNGEIWINGHHLGKRPYGYIGFAYDLTPHLNSDGDNILAVRVDNSLQPSSRWYNGSGIYRHVWLTCTDPIRVEHWGTQVSTTKVSSENAVASIRTTVRNGCEEARRVTVTQSILAPDGKPVGTSQDELEMEAGGESVLEQTMAISAPLLWSPESPRLYVMRTELRDGSRLTDCYETPFGVRDVRFDPDQGLFLNGKPVLMKGVCNHHDLGPLGAALWDQALERRLRMLKEMGCNAIRTAHNPPSPELLNFCDQMGFMVIDETFDEWRRGWDFKDGKMASSTDNKGKAKFGYHLYFDEWAERDLTDHLRRDRNHPSVILWSVGNEVPEAQRFGELETLKRLRDICHSLDPTRPMTVGCNFIAGANESGFAELMDVVGYNGGGGSCFQYEADHLRYPERKIYASEVPHTLQTRGEYRAHSQYREKKHQPPHLTEEEVFPETDAWHESSYDNAGVRICARDSWRLTKNLPFVAGEFRWTGFDYLGESGGWPRVIGNFGIIDICNFPKDTYFFYKSQWTPAPMVHILPHWTWPGKEGKVIPVWCYSNCDEVELFLNDTSLGIRKFTAESDMHLEWLVPYAPGELKAIARKQGVEVTAVTRTARPPARVTIAADQVELKSRRDLSYVTIRIEDRDANLVPKASNWVNLEITGPGRIVGVGNGDPLSHESFQGRHVRAFNGLALVIVAQAGNEPGEIMLKASARGLDPSEVSFNAN